MGYTFLHYADINHRINGAHMEDVSDYEMCQEDDLGDTFPDFNADKYLDDPRHDQAYFLNKGDY